MREFLGTTDFFTLWIPGFAELARPLYTNTKETENFSWTKEHQGAFEKIKEALVSAPALGLPDITKPFHLFVDEHKGVAKGVLVQTLGPWKRLDSVASGWPPCLRIIAATALLVKDAVKLTGGKFGGDYTACHRGGP